MAKMDVDLLEFNAVFISIEFSVAFAGLLLNGRVPGFFIIGLILTGIILLVHMIILGIKKPNNVKERKNNKKQKNRRPNKCDCKNTLWLFMKGVFAHLLQA